MFAAKPVDYSFVFTQTRLAAAERMTDCSSSSLLVRKPLCFLTGSQDLGVPASHRACDAETRGGGTDIGQSIIKTNAINFKQEQK